MCGLRLGKARFGAAEQGKAWGRYGQKPLGTPPPSGFFMRAFSAST